MDPIITILCTAVGSSGLSAVIVALLNRHWTKKDREDSRLGVLIDAQKVVMVDRVRWLGQKYIETGSISLEEKETLHEMYASYKALGGNGHLVTVMNEVDRLPLKEKGVKQ